MYGHVASRLEGQRWLYFPVFNLDSELGGRVWAAKDEWDDIIQRAVEASPSMLFADFLEQGQ